jgi:hypothetical protein
MVSLGVLGPHMAGRANAASQTSLPSLHGPLSRDVFLALREQTFTAVIEHRRMALFLVKVTDEGSAPEGEQFTVLFAGPRDQPLADGTCVLSHATAGSAPLYLQSAGKDGRASYYRAPFNLLS